MQLINGDCLEKMKDISNNSIDFLFCDLPYGQTSCKWDCVLDLELFWREINRICKIDCPMFFTCTTKFGVSLINSNPKNFRYDLVWVKSASCGFLNAKKMPMKKHEMIYVFYRKLPFYDLSSHTHKFLIEGKCTFDTGEMKSGVNSTYGKIARPDYMVKNGESQYYEPPLPNSVIKTELYSSENKEKPRELYRNEGGQYDPPLPNSVIKQERNTLNYKNNSVTYGKINRPDYMRKNGESAYDPPLPNSVIKQECKSQTSREMKAGVNNLYGDMKGGTIGNIHGTNYEPPLPNTLLEIKSEKGKHATQKPVELIKYLLKYYSKEGNLVLDPTMGSGSTGVACKEMNRHFIGIEKDEKIFKVAKERLE